MSKLRPKSFLDTLGGAPGPHFVLGDNGEVKYVLLKYSEYNRLKKFNDFNDEFDQDDFSNSDLSSEELLESINYKISDWLAGRDDDGEEDVVDLTSEGEDEIEDIPF